LKRVFIFQEPTVKTGIPILNRILPAEPVCPPARISHLVGSQIPVDSDPFIFLEIANTVLSQGVKWMASRQ